MEHAHDQGVSRHRPVGRPGYRAVALGGPHKVPAVADSVQVAARGQLVEVHREVRRAHVTGNDLLEAQAGEVGSEQMELGVRQEERREEG